MGREFSTKESIKGGKNSSRKGIPNKSTQEIRDAFQDLVANNIVNVQDLLDEVKAKNPAKALELIMGLSKYVIPELSRTEIKDVTEVDLSNLSDKELKAYNDINKKITE